MGHIGLSSDGAGFLSCEGVLRSVTNLAASCPVYSVRGVCFHALCLVATTKEGVTQLRKYGECVGCVREGIAYFVLKLSSDLQVVMFGILIVVYLVFVGMYWLL